MTDVLINFIGVLMIVLIIWWFWIATARAVNINANRAIDILVKDGVYTPSRIEVPANQDVVMRFVREDASPCAEKVIFGELDKAFDLPLNQPVDVTLHINEPGEYHFSCDMQMYRGTLLVKPD